VPVTYLQMTDPSELVPAAEAEDELAWEPVAADDWAFNRRMYREVGADWQWQDKEAWSEEQWRDYVGSPGVRTYAALLQGELVGYLELVTSPEEVQINYFGLLPAFIGRGLGGQLLTTAIRMAWQLDPRRVWLHTCDKDHPGALANYLARGFQIYKVED